VVIVTYNSAGVLGGCLDSLDDQGVVLTDVLVVDNGSDDDTLAVAAGRHDLPLRTIEMGRNAGYASGINAGLARLDMSSVDSVMVLNPDCRLAPGAIDTLARALRHPGRGIVVPKMLNPDGSLQPSIRHEATVRRALAEALLGRITGRVNGLGELVTASRVHDRPGRVAWATGAAMLIARATIERIGEWDESFLLYSEETEYCLRAADHGLVTWYEPSAVVEHIGGDQQRDPVLTRLAAVNRLLLFRRRHGRVHAAVFRGVVVLGEAVRALTGRPRARVALEALLHPSRRVNELPSRARWMEESRR
jgi:GT2 family glycosyltransferase